MPRASHCSVMQVRSRHQPCKLLAAFRSPAADGPPVTAVDIPCGYVICDEQSICYVITNLPKLYRNLQTCLRAVVKRCSKLIKLEVLLSSGQFEEAESSKGRDW